MTYTAREDLKFNNKNTAIVFEDIKLHYQSEEEGWINEQIVKLIELGYLIPDETKQDKSNKKGD